MPFVDADELEATQLRLGRETPPPFMITNPPLGVAGVFGCFGRGGGGPGAGGDRGWGGAAVFRDGRCVETVTVSGTAGGPYRPGLLALREGSLLTAAAQALQAPFELLLVNATGWDHPRHAGLALHLGAHLQVASIGVTNRPLRAGGAWPVECERGARAPLTIDGEIVGYWVRTRANTRPLAIHPGWRTDPEGAVGLVLAVTAEARTPEPLRMARRLAREARSRATP